MSCAIVWLRRDLRLADNPALAAAVKTCREIIPLYIHAPEESGAWAPGAASNWWLHHSLTALGASLAEIGSSLVIRHGSSLAVLRQVARDCRASHVFWNRLYEPAHVERDTQIKNALRGDHLSAESFNGSLLFEPWEVSKADGEAYRVFTPFWRACTESGLPNDVAPAPTALPTVAPDLTSLVPEDLRLLPSIPWGTGIRSSWRVGERAAAERLESFLRDTVAAYADNRNRPDREGTSRLSPHLHFGEVAPRRIVLATQEVFGNSGGEGGEKGKKAFLSEIGWREFAHHALYHFPHTTNAPLDTRFEDFGWVADYGPQLKAWQQGRTGIPMVDAGMRELWHGGWMHNRTRMTVASFLTKNLLIPWQEGARWFWDTLVDADLANNTLGWQWTAGCGLDAAPYFRVFNPALQGKRFDPEGAYVRRWIPEIAELPDKYLHQPWTAPEGTLRDCRVDLGQDYPRPIVDLKATRERALARFEAMRKAR